MADLKDNNLGLEYLLELNGEIFPMDNGYWTKIEAKVVNESEHIPHGIKYSLTLHDRSNERVLGYDNAHGVRTNKTKFKVMKTKWDHKHERNTITSYDYKSAGKLLEDFWSDVNKIVGDS